MSHRPEAADGRAQEVRRRFRALVETGDPAEWAYAWRAELSHGGFPAVDFLVEEVVQAGKCVGCAACVTICPAGVLAYEGERPRVVQRDACVYCALCPEVCPILQPGSTVDGLVDYRHPVQDQGFGPYNYAVLARTRRPEVMARGQDGGAVTTVLLHEFETGEIRGAIVGDSDPDDPQFGRARLATSPDEVLASAGSRYTYVPNTLALADALRRNVAPLAVVGVPCQVDGLRYQQQSSIRLGTADWYRDNVALVVGLFCSEAFTSEGIEALSAALGVDRRDITGLNVKGEVLVRLRDGREETFPLPEFRRYARPACEFCLDYGAARADISAGGIGLRGWTLLVVRTDAGHEALGRVCAAGWLEVKPVSSEPKAERLLVKMAKRKGSRPHPSQVTVPAAAGDEAGGPE